MVSETKHYKKQKVGNRKLTVTHHLIYAKSL
jgi:hypothetical protein